MATWRRMVVPLAVSATPPVGLALGVAALRAARPDDIGPLGLVEALPATLYVALALLTVSFLGSVFFAPGIRPAVLAAHVVAFTVLLHGAATIVEPLPRFVPAWLHVGFTDYIARTGHTLPELDARFSWPGVFAIAAMATRAAGLGDAMSLLGWTPIVLNLLYAAVTHRLARVATGDDRAAWLAVWLFLPANWVGQDYFSPQGFNYLFYLIILSVLLIWFRPSRIERTRQRIGRYARGHVRPAAPDSHPVPAVGSQPVPTVGLPPVGSHPVARRRRLLRVVGLPSAPMRHEPEPVAASRPARAGLILAVIVVFIASTASHQLTPMAILVTVAALVAVRRCSVRGLPVLLAMIFLGYLSYLTVAYWSGHLHDMFGSFGRLGHTVDAGVSKRVRGDAGHLLVLQVRQVLALGVWGLALLGAWRLMRRGRGDLAVLASAGAPFLLLLFQSYGGEVFLRIYTFALPFMIILIVALLVPLWPPRRRVLVVACVALLSVTLTGAFFVARYGNESFERVRPADVRAVEWLYANAAPGATFVALTSNVPWRSRDLEQYRYTPLGEDLGPGSLPAIEAAMEANPRGAYLILTEGQYAMGVAFYGKPPGWGEEVERQVAASSHFRQVYSREGAEIFVLAQSRGGVG
jgi:hypothetical protein